MTAGKCTTKKHSGMLHGGTEMNRKVNRRNADKAINNNKGGREMNKILERVIRTGLMTIGTAAGLGFIFGTTQLTAHAAETADNDASSQAEPENAAPGTEADAKAAVDAAKSKADSAEEAVGQAEEQVRESSQAVENASEKADQARQEADQAFDQARADAADRDQEAERELAAAKNHVEEAEATAQQAETEAEAAGEACRKAEDVLAGAKAEGNVTEEDIAQKEAELQDREDALKEAETSAGRAEQDRDLAAAEAADKDRVRQKEQDRLDEAEAGREEAAGKVREAEQAAAEADGDLQTARGLKDGSLQIEDTSQYKEKEEAEAAMERASRQAEQAEKERDQADADLAKAESAENAAKDRAASAAEDVREKKSALEKADHAGSEAETALHKAQQEYDDAAAKAAKADALSSSAEQAFAAALQSEADAAGAKEKADSAAAEARKTAERTRADAEAAADAAIREAEREADQKKSIAEEAGRAVSEAADQYRKGTLGLIDWMLAKEGLTELQIKDLQDARKVLEDAAEESDSRFGEAEYDFPAERNGKLLVIGDEKDASDLSNLQKSIEVMKEINELRASDDNYTGDMQRLDANTNFRFTAIAEAGAMRGAALRRHSLLMTGCENLAFGFSDPNVGWYYWEKAAFDKAKNDLGITTIRSEEDIYRIEEEADRQNMEVGHYTNLMLAPRQVMGVGYTDYGNTYCYNASKVYTSYDGTISNDRQLYTIDDFEKIVSAYCQSINKADLEEKAEKAAAAQTEAEGRLQQLIDGRESTIKAAVKESEDRLAAAETVAEQAEQVLAASSRAVTEAARNAGIRKAAKEQAAQEAAGAAEVLTQAEENCRTAAAAIENAAKALEQAVQAGQEADTNLRRAEEETAAARTALTEKEAVLTAAKTSLDAAAASFAEASDRLAELTSDQRLQILSDRKAEADQRLQSAQNEKAAREAEVNRALAAAAAAGQEAAEARTRLEEAENSLADRISERDQARETVDAAAAVLRQLQDRYRPIAGALAAAEEAWAQLNRTMADSKTAQDHLTAARAAYSEALQAREAASDLLTRAAGLSVEDALEKDIEDEDFSYLNPYATALRTALEDLDAAKEAYDTANADLKTRQAESAQAMREYAAALADLALLQTGPDADPESGVTDQEWETPMLPGVCRYSQAGYNMAGTAACRAGTEMEEGSRAKSVADAQSEKAAVSLEQHTGRSADTGDQANAMALLAECLTGAGFMAVCSRKRRS